VVIFTQNLIDMKLRIGTKLLMIREERRLTQAEMADLLALSTSAYQRLERGESQCDFAQLTRFSEILNIPIQEFLPDTVAFHNHNEGPGPGIIFGNYIVNLYAGTDISKTIEELILEIKEIKGWLDKKQK
jgi:transcriptional regulator with XRE-family HTH domain